MSRFEAMHKSSINFKFQLNAFNTTPHAIQQSTFKGAVIIVFSISSCKKKLAVRSPTGCSEKIKKKIKVKSSYFDAHFE